MINYEIITRLAKIVLPENILDYYELENIVDNNNTIMIHLSEKVVPPSPDFIFDGFFSSLTYKDFPMRGKKVTLIIKKIRWINKITNELYTNKYNIPTNGKQHVKEYADYLKSYFGCIPDYGPFS